MVPMLVSYSTAISKPSFLETQGSALWIRNSTGHVTLSVLVQGLLVGSGSRS